MYKFPWSTYNPKAIQPWNWHIPQTSHHRYIHLSFFSNHPIEHKIAAFKMHSGNNQNAFHSINTKEKTKRMDINTTNYMI
jgi:hypothetical protein